MNKQYVKGVQKQKNLEIEGSKNDDSNANFTVQSGMKKKQHVYCSKNKEDKSGFWGLSCDCPWSS